MVKKDKLAKREGAMAKAFSMSVLFNEKHYDTIVGILDNIQSANIDEHKNSFKTACGNAGLDPADQEWLWNYLKHYNKGLADNSDAKWKVLDTDGNPHW